VETPGTASVSSNVGDASAADAMGLITDHAYSLLAVKVGACGTRLLKLRNPWGKRLRL
jgi:hypothetical protein